LPEHPVVIFLTIDALRADMFLNRRHDRSIPTLAELRDTSVNFSMARTPGSQTVVTLTSLFAGTYFSQQYWTRRPGVRDLWPHEDRSVRFPELLTNAGVNTVTFATAKMFTNDYGMVRGFTHSRYVKGPRKWYAYSHQVIPRLNKVLRKLGSDESLFAYMHLLDAHYTMSPLGKKLPRRKRFVRNLAAVDRQLKKLLRTLRSRKLLERTALIISADHGEGFGQHGTKYHCENLYEELVRVPLLMKLPGVERRNVSEPVSLIDMGPTVLDLMGLPTPGHYMGQSLTGFLRGESPRLTRPIVAEGRLKKSLVFTDGHKVVVDDRHHTVELYDLIRDPREKHNLFEKGSPLAVERLLLLRKFFSVHTIQRAGYKVPYRF
jgi:arylsulfatase A-like enzyme